MGIFPKIECALGVQNFDEILKASEGVMVARGDLGIEIAARARAAPAEDDDQAKCNAAYKPVITATQMLDSMIRNPRPTRAEVADVANAIYDGTDAVMLSGESAAGKYPVEAVRMQACIAHETEQPPGPSTVRARGARAGSHEHARDQQRRGSLGREHGHHRGREVRSSCPTTTGRSARLISHFRPKPSRSWRSRATSGPCRRCSCTGASSRTLAAITQGTVDETVQKAIQAAKDCGCVEKNDLAVVTVGDPKTSVALADKVTSTNVAYVVQVH